MSVGTIHGGLSVNTVPDHCTVEIDRRVLPGEQTSDVYQEVIEYVARQPGINFPVEHEPVFLRGPSLSDTHNGPLADRLVSAARQRLGRGEKIGVPYGTDAATIAGAGVPSVVFGPGSIDQAAHGRRVAGTRPAHQSQRCAVRVRPRRRLIYTSS